MLTMETPETTQKQFSEQQEKQNGKFPMNDLSSVGGGSGDSDSSLPKMTEASQPLKMDPLPQKNTNGVQETTKLTETANTSKSEGGSGVEGNMEPTLNETHKNPSLVKEQIKYCTTVLKGLKRHPQSSPFQHPVDPVALNIPDYFDIIKNPMDLSLIQKKMDSGDYTDSETFISDVRLMLNNCFTYNHPDSQVAKMGRSLEKYFNTAIGKIPTTIPNPEEERQKRKSEESISPLAANRARRESHAPSRLAATSGSASTPNKSRSRSVHNPEVSFCASILRELLKKSNQTVAWPFLEPVDPVKLGIPDYFTVIKHPMDLSTVKRKMDTGQYSSSDQFESDIRLIISNCFTYNAPDSDVVNICRGFEKLFDSKWSQKPSNFHYSASSVDDADSDSEKILEINRKIQALQQELNTLLMKRRSKTPSSRQKKAPRPASSKPAAAPLITEEDFLNRPMSFEDKRQLSIEVNNLNPEKLGRVVEIIQAGMALETQGDSDVIELDIESLNLRTLRQLQKYVMECKGITSLSAILGESPAPAPKRKKTQSSNSSSGNKKLNNNSATPTTAAAAAAVAMSSDEDDTDEDLD